MAVTSVYIPNKAVLVHISEEYIGEFLNGLAQRKNWSGDSERWKSYARVHHLWSLKDEAEWEILIQPLENIHPAKEHGWRPKAEEIIQHIKQIPSFQEIPADACEMKEVERDSYSTLPDRRVYHQSQVFKEHHSEEIWERYYGNGEPSSSSA